MSFGYNRVSLNERFHRLVYFNLRMLSVLYDMTDSLNKQNSIRSDLLLDYLDEIDSVSAEAREAAQSPLVRSRGRVPRPKS